MDDSSSDDDSHHTTIAAGQNSSMATSSTVIGSFRQTTSTDLSTNSLAANNFEEVKGRDISSTVVEPVQGSLRQLIDSPNGGQLRDSSCITAQIDKVYDNERTYTH